MDFSLVVESGGFSLVVVCELLIVVASLIVEHGPYGMWAQQSWFPGSRAQAQWLWHTGLVAPQHVGSSLTRNRTYVSGIGKRILYP